MPSKKHHRQKGRPREEESDDDEDDEDESLEEEDEDDEQDRRIAAELKKRKELERKKFEEEEMKERAREERRRMQEKLRRRRMHSPRADDWDDEDAEEQEEEEEDPEAKVERRPREEDVEEEEAEEDMSSVRTMESDGDERRAHKATLKRGLFTPDMDEDEKKDVIVAKLQAMWRARVAHRQLRVMIRANFAKVVDNETGTFCYKNKRTGQVYRSKPKFLGEPDLPDPRTYDAPRDYAAPPPAVRTYAMVLANLNFSNCRLPALPNCILNDFDDLREILLHPFFCKLHDDESSFLKKATKSMFEYNLRTLVEKVPADGTLLLYLATHIIHIQSGRHRDGYLVMADSYLKDVASVVATCVSLRWIAAMINRVRCRARVVFVDGCHLEKPQNLRFKSVVPYPPPNLCQRLARLAHAAVISSCYTGTHPREMEKYDKYVTMLVENEQADLLNAVQTSQSVASPTTTTMPTTTNNNNRASNIIKNHNNTNNTTNNTTTTNNNNNSHKRPTGGGDVYDLKERMHDTYEFLQRVTGHAPEETVSLETAHYWRDGTRSLFGPPLVSALSGQGITEPVKSQAGKDYITLRHLYTHFSAMFKAHHATKLNLEGRPATPEELPPQTVQVAVPLESWWEWPLCDIPAPPPRLPVPVATKVTRSSITLEWRCPKWGGAKPIRYDLQSYGNARVTQQWDNACPKAVLTGTTMTVSNLPAGFRFKFRVRALNLGGWGEYSRETQWYQTLQKEVSTLEDAFRVKAKAGARVVIRLMDEKKHILQAQLLGCHKLMGVVVAESGFRRGSTARECVKIVLQAMKTFSNSMEMQRVGGLLAGWACANRVIVADDAVTLGVLDVIKANTTKFKFDAAVMAAMDWAKRKVEISNLLDVQD